MNRIVFDQILSIRDSGTVNMLDVNGVQRLSFDKGYYELVCYIEEDKSRYFRFILSGQLPDDEENPSDLTALYPSLNLTVGP